MGQPGAKRLAVDWMPYREHHLWNWPIRHIFENFVALLPERVSDVVAHPEQLAESDLRLWVIHHLQQTYTVAHVSRMEVPHLAK